MLFNLFVTFERSCSLLASTRLRGVELRRVSSRSGLRSSCGRAAPRTHLHHTKTLPTRDDQGGESSIGQESTITSPARATNSSVSAAANNIGSNAGHGLAWPASCLPPPVAPRPTARVDNISTSPIDSINETIRLSARYTKYPVLWPLRSR